ncbi:MAG: hypothetical protein QOJ42_7219 [Acidobacteriaceae bacterium]|nr:hypothetical protein [Acidobacteriaceae bacterium]
MLIWPPVMLTSGNVCMVDLWLDLGADPAQKGSPLSAWLTHGRQAERRFERLLQYPVDVYERVDEERLLTCALERSRRISEVYPC